MAISFPASPALNDTYTVGTKTWVYNGYAWDLSTANLVPVFDKANNALANTTGVTFEGNLRIKTDLYIGNNITNVTSLVFNTSTNRTPTTPGELTWSQDDSTLRFDMDTTTNVIGHIGQDLFYYVKNQTGSSIAKGTVVRFAGTLGASGRLLIAPAIANNSYPSKYVMGVTATSIANGDDGFVLSQGKLRQIDTSMFSEGDILYVSPSTPGAFSNTMPTAPNNKITVAAVVKKDNTVGAIEVRVTLGSKLNEDELAEIGTLTNGDVLQYVSANGRFENKQTLVNAYGMANAAFDKANSANVLAYNTGIGANAFTYSYANGVANSANAYAITVGAASNTYGNSSFYTIANGSSAFAFANGVNANVFSLSTYANTNHATYVFANGVANSSNAYAVTVGAASNTYANGSFYTIANGSSAFAFANGVNSNVFAISAYANTNHATYAYANGVANSSNSYSASLVTGLATYAYANGVANSSNSYAAANFASNAYANGTANAANAFAASYTNVYANGTANAANSYAAANFASNAYANGTANAANAYAITIGAASNTWANTKVAAITSNSTSRIWANAVTVSGIETVYLDLSTSGVSAAAYTSGISALTVDAYGRVTAVTGSANYLANGSVTLNGTLTLTANVDLSNTNVLDIKTATFTAQQVATTTTGAVTINWSSAQNWKQNEPTGTITYTFVAPPGPCHLQLLIDSDGTSTAQTLNWPAAVIWIEATWAGINNKKAVINFWYDGTNYYAMGNNQV